MDKIRAAAYARVSTESESQLQSFNNQLGYFEKRITDAGRLFVGLYSDEGVSGVRWKNRDGFNEMLTDAGILVVEEFNVNTKKYEINYYPQEKPPLFTEVWVKNTARFARNINSFEIVQMLRKKGVILRFESQNLDTADPSKDFWLQMMLGFDENESRLKSEAVKWGYKRGMEKGRIYTHPKIYGYDYIKETNELKKNNTAYIVELVFNLYTIEEFGLRRIANELDNRKIKTQGGSKWQISTIRNILKNEKYMGKNNPLKLDGGEFNQRTSGKVKKDYQVIDHDRIDKIIEPETFQKAQELLKSKNQKFNGGKYNKGQKVPFSLFSKMIICGNCGSNYTRNFDYNKNNKNQKTAFFNCSIKKRRGTATCDNWNVSEAEIWATCWSIRYGERTDEIRRQKRGCEFWLSKLILEKYQSLDLDSEAKARQLNAKIEDLKDEIKELARKSIMYPDFDKFGALSEMIEEKNEKIEKFTVEMKELKKANHSINKEIKDLLNKRDLLNNLEIKGNEYNEATMPQDMIYKLVIYKSKGKPTVKNRAVIVVLYKILKEALYLILENNVPAEKINKPLGTDSLIEIEEINEEIKKYR